MKRIALLFSLGLTPLLAEAQTGSSGGPADRPMHRRMHEMTCSQMMGAADISIKNTSDGAVLRFHAKDPNEVQRVQEMASRMAECMGGKPSTREPSPSR